MASTNRAAGRTSTAARAKDKKSAAAKREKAAKQAFAQERAAKKAAKPAAAKERAAKKTKPKGRATASRREGAARGATSSSHIPSWRPVERTQFLIDTVGGVTNLARTLGVSASQPSRWKTGEEVPSPEVASKLLDLDHVLALAVQAWDPKVAIDWMSTANGFLDGARPIDVVMQRGSADVLDALKATISGAYA